MACRWSAATPMCEPIAASCRSRFSAAPTSLLTSFDAEPGDSLIAAIDLRGRYREPFSNWEAATDAPHARLRGDLELLPRSPKPGCRAPPRISARAASSAPRPCWPNAPASPSTSIFDAIPKPAGVALERWLLTFPSFGYLLSVKPRHVAETIARFAARGIAAAAIGSVAHGSRVTISDGTASETIWDFAQQPLIGAGRRARRRWRRWHDRKRPAAANCHPRAFHQSARRRGACHRTCRQPDAAWPSRPWSMRPMPAARAFSARRCRRRLRWWPRRPAKDVADMVRVRIADYVRHFETAGPIGASMSFMRRTPFPATRSRP